MLPCPCPRHTCRELVRWRGTQREIHACARPAVSVVSGLISGPLFRVLANLSPDFRFKLMLISVIVAEVDLNGMS